MAAGDYSCADLVTINVKLAEMWADSAVQAEFVANTKTAQAVLAEQTANFEVLEDPKKDHTVRIYWPDSCVADPEDCTDECVVSGVEPEATCQDYSLTLCKKTTLSIGEKQFRSSNLSFEEVVARGMMKHKKALDEQISKTAVASIDSFAGVNAYTGGVGNVVAADTFISASNWTPSLFAYFIQTGQLNKYINAYFLSGSNMFQQELLAQANSGNANGSGNANLMNTFRKYFDLFNVDQILTPDKKSFLIDKAAVAIVSKNYYEETPRQYLNGANQIRFSIPSDNLPGVRYDVIYVTDCSSNEIDHVWRFTATYDVFLNPASVCDANRTGVLSFTCGEAP